MRDVAEKYAMADIATMKDSERAEGRTEGMDRVSKLINHLARQGKTDEILKVTSDPDYRDQMLKSLNM